ncbi:hypothetical protein [Streptomyces sp. NPDC052179]|uniref:hypothetical protein n=1 Tax=Streptomyces sp. NPDC052179 TaxID=3155680 RepID=UPI0034491B56
MRPPRARVRPGRRTAAGAGALLAAVLLALVPLPSGADQARAAQAATTEQTAQTARTASTVSTASTASTARAASAGRAADVGSAVTRSGTKGPYDDFSGLRVTVHQTEHLRAQGVKVTWTGGRPTPLGGKFVNYLQIMQCWGDSSGGPDRESCDFGAVRAGGSYNGSRVLPEGWDPQESEYTQGEGNFSPFVPFRPVTGKPTEDAYDFTYFGPNDSNAEPLRKTQPDGTGEAIFEVQTALQAPHLGCGEVNGSGGKPRSCWLVVVPRGEHETEAPANGNLDTSPLSRSNWDRRMVFPLRFDPVGATCDPDRPERRIIGSELLTDAVSSWQTVLCDGLDARFTFSQSGEDHARSLIRNPSATSPGMAVTVDPVETAEGAPPVVHAPLAVSGLSVGFLWEHAGAPNEWVRDLRLSPRLLAKMLTQSYVAGVSLWSVDSPKPPHLAGNPEALVSDPEFVELNPAMAGRAARSGPLGMVAPSENSDTSRLLWRYLQSDRDAREFLSGKPDPWGMKLNPFYRDMVLDKEAPDYFPKADPTETRASAGPTEWAVYTGAEIVPYAENLHDGALRVRRGYSGQTTNFEVCAECATGGKLTGERSPQGMRQVAGLVDAPSADRYQLDIAALPNADGEFVVPTEKSLLAAVAQMKDSAVAGVKAPDPARARNGAYPLTAVAYAAATTDQPAAARRDYARMIRYAAGPGQTAGLTPGQLPHGYAPLPAAMRAQARDAAGLLERGAGTPPGAGTPGGGRSAGPGGDGTAGGPASGADSGGTGGGTAAGGGSAGGPGPDGSPGTAAGADDTSKVAATASGAPTPSQVLGLIRWVLLGVLIAGGAAALAGPVMMRLSARRAAAGSG